MISSKFKILSLVLVSTALAACSPESRKDKESISEIGNVRNFDRSSDANFYVDAVSITDSSIDSYNSYGMPKKKLFNFKACVKDVNLGSILEGTKFRIADDNGGSIPVTLPMDGCLYWAETHEYNVLSDEVFYRLERTVHADSVYRGWVKIRIAFNPWADGGKAVKDLRYNQLSPNEPLVDLGPISVQGGRVFAQQNRANVNLNVDSLNFEFKGLDLDNYEINNLLGLTVAHRYLIRIKPVALRRTMSKVVQPESFVGGKLKAYFAIFKEDKDPAVQYSMNNLISVTEFEVSDDQRVGTFYTDNMIVKFDRIADMTSRTAALLTLVPMDNEEGLGELSFYGVMKPGRLASLSLVPSTVSARDFSDQYKTKKQAAPNAVDAYIAHTKAQPLDVAPVAISSGFFSAQKNYDPKADLDAAVNGGTINDANKENLRSALCAKIYAAEASKIRPCQRRPDQYLTLEIRDFVDKVLSAPRVGGPTTTQKLTMNVSYTLSESQGTSSGRSASLRSGVGLDMASIITGAITAIGTVVAGPVGGVVAGQIVGALSAIGFKFSIGAEYFNTVEARKSAMSGGSAAVTSGVEITAEGNTFLFDVAAKRCLIVSSKNADSKNPTIETKDPRVAYHCSEKVTKQSRTETYFLLGQSLGLSGSPFSDSDANNSTNWRMMIRGKENALLLFDLLQKANLDLMVSKTPDSGPNSPLAKEFNTIQDFPGVLSKQ